jgi:hypothetical protein
MAIRQGQRHDIRQALSGNRHSTAPGTALPHHDLIGRPVKIVHLVNPAKAAADSELHMSQPVTFVSLRKARRYSGGEAEIDILAACYAEDLPVVPPDIPVVRHLVRSARDKIGDSKAKNYPLSRIS